jgi:fatty acid synthase
MSVSETENTVCYEKVQSDGLGLTGCCRALFSNSLSYWLGTNGKLEWGHNNLKLLR